MKIRKDGGIAEFLNRWSDDRRLPENFCPLVRRLAWKIPFVLLLGLVVSFIVIWFVGGTLLMLFAAPHCDVSRDTFLMGGFCWIPGVMWGIALLTAFFFTLYWGLTYIGRGTKYVFWNRPTAKYVQRVEENFADVWDWLHGRICPSIEWDDPDDDDDEHAERGSV